MFGPRRSAFPDSVNESMGTGFGNENAAWPSPDGAAGARSEQGELAWAFDDATGSSVTRGQ